MSTLTREAILAATDTCIERVAVPEWGGEVSVRSLTGAERDWLEGQIVQRTGKTGTINNENLRAKLCTMTLCDADGQRLFTEQDMTALAAKSAAALDRVFQVAARLSGLRDEDLVEAARSFAPARSDGSPSDSPAIVASLMSV